MEDKYYIYSIFNTKTNKSYIGICNNYNRRMREHRTKLKKHKHENRYLQSSWDKHGESSFEWFVIKDNVDMCDIHRYEKMLISMFETKGENGYNLTDGGAGVLGYKHTEDHIESLKKPRPELRGEKHPFYNKKHSEETKKYISTCMSGCKNGMYGKKHSNETIELIRKAAKNRKNTRKRLSQDDINNINNMIDNGVTQKEIALLYNVGQPTISDIKRNKY